MWKRLWGYELRSVIAKLVFGFCASKYLDKASGHIVDLRDVFFWVGAGKWAFQIALFPCPLYRSKILESQTLTQSIDAEPEPPRTAPA